MAFSQAPRSIRGWVDRSCKRRKFNPLNSVHMIRQYRIDRYNGLEFLVCEVYNRHTWTKEEMDAYRRFMDGSVGKDSPLTQSDFRVLLDEWLSDEHSLDETFYGLREPIPVVEYIPCIVVRGAIVNNRVASLATDFQPSVTPLEVMDIIGKFFEFVRSPHWRNTILHSISDYGTLFGPDNDC